MEGKFVEHYYCARFVPRVGVSFSCYLFRWGNDPFLKILLIFNTFHRVYSPWSAGSPSP